LRSANALALWLRFNHPSRPQSTRLVVAVAEPRFLDGTIYMGTTPPSLHQDDITVKGRVAVWVGSFTDELHADDYLNVDRGFERDFGFQIADRRGPEMTVTPKPVSIRELVEGFSCWHDYADAVVTAAEAAGIRAASTMLVFHWVEFDPRRVSVNLSAPLRFLGNFDFQGFR
jgi:hypothetical protein